MPEATTMVCQDLNAIGKGKLGGNETLAAVVLLPGTGAPDSTGSNAPWTPDNTYLTARLSVIFLTLLDNSFATLSSSLFPYLFCLYAYHYIFYLTTFHSYILFLIRSTPLSLIDSLFFFIQAIN